MGVGLIVILGKQGAGKGTQCPLLAARYGVPHVATGDMLRCRGRSGSELGGQGAARSWTRATSCPTTSSPRSSRHRLAEPDCVRGAILDGYPRTEAQAIALEEIAGAARASRGASSSTCRPSSSSRG